MKKLILFFFTMLCAITINAQDVIVKKDGSTVLCKIIQVNESEVIYLKWSDLKGPKYIMDSSLVSNINYQDGRQERLNQQTSNAYAPGNQQTGDARYNDNALLAIDQKIYMGDSYKKAKKLEIIGWTAGATMVTAGALILIIRAATAQGDENAPYYIGSSIAFAGGIAATTTCLIMAHKLKNEAKMITSTKLFHKDFEFSDGLGFSAGIDIIHNYQTHHIIPGLGVQFNF